MVLVGIDHHVVLLAAAVQGTCHLHAVLEVDIVCLLYTSRMKFRSTGLPLVSCLETIARGTKIADLIAIGGTLDYVVPDIDR